MSEARFFKTGAEWRAWLETNHAEADEQWVGFPKVGSGKTGITYQEALDEALRFGWVESGHRGGHAAWSVRFTPRQAGTDDD